MTVCLVDNCGVALRPGQIMCVPHLRMLPVAMRRKLYGTWKSWHCRLVSSAEVRRVESDAVQYLTNRLRHR